MAEEKRKSLNEQIAELKTRISNCKDVRQSEKLINQLLGLHKSTFEMNRLLDVPLSEIKESIEIGEANILHRTIRGYAWECRGGMITFVEHRMSRVCVMCNTLFELNKVKDNSPEDMERYNVFSNAVAYIFQSPIFGSMDEISLFEIATAILSSFNSFYDKNYTNAEAVSETEQDLLDNAEAEAIAKGFEALAEAPIPPED